MKMVLNNRATLNGDSFLTTWQRLCHMALEYIGLTVWVLLSDANKDQGQS